MTQPFETLIIESHSILQQALEKELLSIDIDYEAGRLRIKLRKGLIVYVRYNNYGQYSYMIQFSMKLLDRIRFDNFDEKWPNSTWPHHCHPRFKKEAIMSQFRGNPKADLPKLAELIMEHLE